MQFTLEQQDIFTVESLQLIIPFQKVLDSNKEIRLTPIEFKLFFILLKNHDHPVPRVHLMEWVWAGMYVQERVLDSHISDLRKKLKKTGHSIVNIRSVGYQLILKKEEKT